MSFKFSIVTPSYNQADFIEETIKSIWSQKGNFLIEHIVIDGGSTDKTVDILKKYEKLSRAKKYKNLKFVWLSEKDRGQADALNKGFRLATGDILAYLNSDDLYCKGAFLRVADFFKKHPRANVVFSDYWTIDERSKKIKKHKCNAFTRNHLLNKGNPVGQPAVFWKKEVYKAIGGFKINYQYCMDYDYWCRITKKFKFYPLKNISLACFRVHRASKSVFSKDRFFKEQRQASRKNGGKFFSQMFFNHYLQGFENLCKKYLPGKIVSLLQKFFRLFKNI